MGKEKIIAYKGSTKTFAVEVSNLRLEKSMNNKVK